MKKAWAIVGLLGLAQSAQAMPHDLELSCDRSTRALNKFGDLYITAQKYLQAIQNINRLKQESAFGDCWYDGHKLLPGCVVENFFTNGSAIHAARLEIQEKEREFLSTLKKMHIPYSYFDSPETLAAGIGPTGPFVRASENDDFVVGENCEDRN